MSWLEPAILILVLYAIRIRRFDKGWESLPHYSVSNSEKVSLVIAARNEEAHIPSLLASLAKQTHPIDEIIVVDDHSTDETVALLTAAPSIRLLEAVGEGKKAAIAQGVAQAKHPIILTTDADCQMGAHWVEKMLQAFSDRAVQLVVGPVAFTGEQTIFEKGQSLEFMSLIGSGAGAIGIEKAFMCNGANLAYRKDIYANVDSDKASGDDVFLLHHVKKQGGKIAFIKEKAAIVYTQPKETLKAFLQQRQRWAAKSSSYKDREAARTSWLVFLANLALLIAFWQGDYQSIFILFSIKSVVDYPFLRKISRFMDKRTYMSFFIPLQLMYPFYIVYIAIASQLTGFKWKGRKYKQ